MAHAVRLSLTCRLAKGRPGDNRIAAVCHLTAGGGPAAAETRHSEVRTGIPKRPWGSYGGRAAIVTSGTGVACPPAPADRVAAAAIKLPD